MAERVGDRFHYSGAVHIHTTESDGTKPLEEIVEIGRSVDLDFMMFADHMGLSNREAGLEGRYGDTLVMIGYEHNDLDDKNHFLVFGSPDVYVEDLHPREYVAAARADGALGIIAHPIEKRNDSGKYPPYPWTAWDTNLFDGMELWNQMSEWMEKLTPLNKLLMALSPRKSMVGPTQEVLKRWDDLSLTQRCVGIASADAHAFPVDLGPWRVEIFPYKVHFRCLRTHLVLREPLPDDFDSARRVFYDSVRNCRVYISNSRWGCADRFEFHVERKGETATSGESLDSHEGARIVVTLPSIATVKLIRNGEVIRQIKTSRLEHTVDRPGLYRVEAWRGKRGWIFSNHVRLGRVEA